MALLLLLNIFGHLLKRAASKGIFYQLSDGVAVSLVSQCVDDRVRSAGNKRTETNQKGDPIIMHAVLLFPDCQSKCRCVADKVCYHS